MTKIQNKIVSVFGNWYLEFIWDLRFVICRLGSDTVMIFSNDKEN